MTDGSWFNTNVFSDICRASNCVVWVSMGFYMAMNVDDLEDWAIRASQAMQDIIDEAERAEGNDGETTAPVSDCCPDLRALLSELDQIVAGVTLDAIKEPEDRSDATDIPA